MPLTIHDITPIGLCIATQDLFDAKRFQSNFCDNLLLRAKDTKLGPSIINLKRELNSKTNQKKFLDGYKAIIISNIDKIIGLASRYAQTNLRATEQIISAGKELMEKVMFADSFEDIAALEPMFKSKITLPVYELFTDYTKNQG
jgi:hypothetical protein